MIPARDHRATAVESALADLERALCRDRCHVLVSASTGPAKALLLGALAERVAGVLRVIPLPPPDAGGELCAPILRELGEACGEDAEASLVAVVRRLAGQGSALALVVADPRSLPDPLLRRLGRLCALARPGLRLVLVADAGEGRDAISAFMAPLGIGAVKVPLDGPPQRPTSGERPAPFAQPRIEAHGDAMRRRAIRVGARRGRVRRPARLALLGVAVAALVYAAADRPLLPARSAIAAPSAQRHAPTAAPTSPKESAPPPAVAEETAPVALAPVPLPIANAKVEIAHVTPIDVATAVPVAAPAPPADVDASTEPAAPEAPTEPEPPPARTVRVSLNAEPWAHIAIDGRDVGVTPMADLELTEGSHRFRARFPDGRVMERTLRVDEARDHLTFP
ncbi:MAG TPA: hypothetical protein VMW19_01855 [Myxococcota bacterium]|nr:hypothetical protein [Myxococcota bacterium]